MKEGFLILEKSWNFVISLKILKEYIIIEDPEKIQCFNTFPLLLGFIALNIRISLQTYHLKNFNKATCSACTEIA